MARLKFYRRFSSGQEQFDVVECAHYSLLKLNYGAIDVTIYPGFTNHEGITYRVSNEDADCYPTCFIESESTGKTIETLRAPDIEQVVL